MFEVRYEYDLIFNFRLKKDENYNERRDELIRVLKDFGFKKNLTTSSWFLYSIERDDLEEIEASALKVLRKQPYSNKEDVAIIQFLAGKKLDGEIKRSLISVLESGKDYWECRKAYELYELLDDLDDGEE